MSERGMMICFQPGIRNGRRRTFWQAQKGLCHYCKRVMVIEIGYANSVTIDHVVPKCRGGSNKRHNTVAACWRCNFLKGELTENEFRKLYDRAIEEGRMPERHPRRVPSREAVREARRVRRQRVKEVMARAGAKERQVERAGYDPEAMGYTSTGVTLGEIWPTKKKN